MSSETARKSVGVGLVGFGTIGAGVAKVLIGNAELIETRLGFPLRLVRIADLDLETDRGVDLSGIQFDADSKGLLSDPDVDIVIEPNHAPHKAGQQQPEDGRQSL